MGPLPKRKVSKGRRDRRRAHDALGSAASGGVQQLSREDIAAPCVSALRTLQGPAGSRRSETRNKVVSSD